MRRQSGLTLIELMISMVIALVIMVAVSGSYLGAANASKMAEAQGRMNEDAQLALGILIQQLRLAGANPAQPNRTVSTLHNALTATFAAGTTTTGLGIRACDDRFSDVTSATSATALTCGHTTGSTGPASISVSYEADRYNTIPTAASVPTDCLGNGLTSTTYVASSESPSASVTVGVFEAENRYYVGTSTAIVNPSLYCKGRGGAQQPLVENIEDLEFTFGTSRPSNTTTVAGYLRAWDIENNATTPGLAGLTAAQRWGFVRTVRVCVLVRSAEPVAPTTSSSQYYDCSGTLITNAADRRLRRAYISTVVLRNR